MKYNGKNIYEENPSAANRYRQEYADSIERYISVLEEASYETRERFMPSDGFAENIEKYRNDYI